MSGDKEGMSEWQPTFSACNNDPLLVSPLSVEQSSEVGEQLAFRACRSETCVLVRGDATALSSLFEGEEDREDKDEHEEDVEKPPEEGEGELDNTVTPFEGEVEEEDVSAPCNSREEVNPRERLCC